MRDKVVSNESVKTSKGRPKYFDEERLKKKSQKSKRTNIAVSAAAVSALAVFGIILTL